MHGEHLGKDRALGHGGDFHGSRAFFEHGAHQCGSRAPIEHGGHRCGDRASMLHGEHQEGARAFEHGNLPEQDRARQVIQKGDYLTADLDISVTIHGMMWGEVE